MIPALLVCVCLAADDPPDPARWTTELTVTPAGPPVPALKYDLLTGRDRAAGNAAVHYLRAAVVRPASPRDPADARDLDARLLAWEDGPVERLPVEAVREFLKGYRDTLAELDAGSRCDRCDWQQGRPTPEGLAALLPVVQTQRDLMRVLAVRTRLELVEGRFDAAVGSLRTGFRFAKHAAEGPTAVQMLVGLALAQTALARCQEFVGRPGSPNLYWALAALPRPLVDPRPALDGEAAFQAALLDGLDELERGPVTEARAKAVFDAAVDALGRPLDPDERERSGLGAFLDKVERNAALAVHGPAARRELVARGRPAAEADAMPAAQAVLLRAAAYHRERFDEQRKLFFAPYPFARPAMDKLVKEHERLVADPKADPAVRLLAVGFPAIGKLHHAHARLGRRLAQLQAVEAVRLHVAADGLPATLAEVTAVPVPDDPFTGRPFGYARDGTTFAVTAPALDAGREAAEAHVFKVTIRAK